MDSLKFKFLMADDERIYVELKKRKQKMTKSMTKREIRRQRKI